VCWELVGSHEAVIIYVIEGSMSRASELLEKIALAEEQSTADAIRLKKMIWSKHPIVKRLML